MNRMTELLERINYDLPGLKKAKMCYAQGDADGAMDAVIEHFRTRITPKYLFTAKEMEQCKVDGILEDAQETLDHYIYGHKFDGEIDWFFNPTVARMDSDDVAYPDRCEKQIDVFNTHPEVSICSGIVEEFTTDPEVVDARRALPETNAKIMEFAKKRNPFNHPCVMYKKSAVEAAGSYKDFYLLEDYYLWLRMLMAGYQGYKIQEPLLHMRAGSDMYMRRAGWKYAKTQAKLFKFMKDSGFIGNGQYIKSCVIRSGSALAPNWLRKFMFEKVLRK